VATGMAAATAKTTAETARMVAATAGRQEVLRGMMITSGNPLILAPRQAVDLDQADMADVVTTDPLVLKLLGLACEQPQQLVD
jgi:hypothetical protein